MKYTTVDLGRLLGSYLEKIPPLYRQILVASGPLTSTLSLGTIFGYSAILLPQLRDSSIEITQAEESWIASMSVLPMSFGCIIGAYLMDKTGRKTTQILTTIPCFIGWVLIASSFTVSTLLIGRFMTGLCGGFLTPSTCVYISETSEPRLRGVLLGAISSCVAFGVFIVHLLGTFFDWRATSIVCCIFPVISAILLIPVPESPAWLAKNKKISAARNSFFWCRGEGESAKKEVDDMIEKQNFKIEDESSGFMRKAFLQPIFVVIIFIVSNQWAGVNALTFYTVSIMQKTLNDNLDNHLAMLIVDLIRVIMSALACLIMKNVRRRPLALVSGVGTFMSLFVLSSYTYVIKIYPDLGSSWYVIIPMTSLITYICFITIGFVPLPWAMMGEVFPLSSRNVGSGISSFFAYLAFYSVVKTNPIMFDSVGVDGTFFIYGLVALLGTVFLWVFLPETKCKTLQEIEDQFEKK